MTTRFGWALLIAVPVGLVAGATPQYVGSKTCSGCHREIYEKYIGTAMGRSIMPAASSSRLVLPSGKVTVQNGGISYEVSRDGEMIYQTEYGRDAAGAEVFRTTYRLEYAIGSGVNGITYAVRRGNYLFEAPLSYYSRTRTWQLSPGYERENVGFNRFIATGCVACHSGRAQPTPGRDGSYADPPFSELAIGCERCHGPGGQHEQHPSKLNIVNPARISPRLADDICMNCHQGGDTRVFQPGKTYSDFLPGIPLSETVAIFKIPLDPAGGPQTNLLEHNFSMTLSKCYRASGRLTCLTCHDPHALRTKASAPSYYEKKCLSCHATASGCTLSVEQRAKEASGCIGCHMPKADVGFISHSALTNHRIVLRPDAPLPPIAYSQTTSDLPDLIYLNRTDKRPVPPVMLLQAYGELSGRAPHYQARYLELLNMLAAISSDNALVEAAVGRKILRDGGPDANRNAIEHLSKAIRLGFTGDAAFDDLANALSNEGRTPEAIAILKQGIDLSPYAPRLHKFLMVQYINSKQYDLAKATMQRYLELFPDDTFVRDLLKRVGG